MYKVAEATNDHQANNQNGEAQEENRMVEWRGRSATILASPTCVLNVISYFEEDMHKRLNIVLGCDEFGIPATSLLHPSMLKKFDNACSAIQTNYKLKYALHATHSAICSAFTGDEPDLEGRALTQQLVTAASDVQQMMFIWYSDLLQHAKVNSTKELLEKSQLIDQYKRQAEKRHLAEADHLQAAVEVEKKLWIGTVLTEKEWRVVESYCEAVLANNNHQMHLFIERYSKNLIDICVKQIKNGKKECKKCAHETFSQKTDVDKYLRNHLAEKLHSRRLQLQNSIDSNLAELKQEGKDNVAIDYLALKCRWIIRVCFNNKLRSYFQRKYVAAEKAVENVANHSKLFHQGKIKMKQRMIDVWTEILNEEKELQKIFNTDSLSGDIKSYQDKIDKAQAEICRINSKAFNKIGDWDWAYPSLKVYPGEFEKLMASYPASEFEKQLKIYCDVQYGEAFFDSKKLLQLNVDRDIAANLQRELDPVDYFVRLFHDRMQQLNLALVGVKLPVEESPLETTTEAGAQAAATLDKYQSCTLL